MIEICTIVETYIYLLIIIDSTNKKREWLKSPYLKS